MRIYIAGPMANYPELNEPEFRRVENILTARGHTALVPHDIKPSEHILSECPPDLSRHTIEGSEHSAPCYMKADIQAMLNCDAAYMLTGWSASVGADLEHRVARGCGVQVFYTMEEVPFA